MTIRRPVTRWILFTVLAGIICCGPPAAAAATAPEATPAPAAEPWIAPDQEAAKKRAAELVPFVGEVMDECQLCRQQRLRDMRLGVKDQTESYFLLDSPIIRKTEDHYGPVRFMHSKHATTVTDCALCHHYRPLDEQAIETVRCSACHQEPFRKDHPDRLGLKAAYHQQCMGCHQGMNRGPEDCKGCHSKNTPDHTEKIQLAGKPLPWEVTAECLRCHKEAGEDMLKTAHWLLKGPSTNTLGHQNNIDAGKGTISTNNF